MKRILRQLLVLGLLLSYFTQGLQHIHQASITFDEGPHLAIGYATLKTGDFRLQPVHIHPPLANVLAAAPLYLQDDLPDPRDIPGWDVNSLSAITDEIVWKYPAPAHIATAGRLPILGLGVLLGALIFRWASDHKGYKAGLLALSLYAFDPNFIAHGSLITTDMATVLLSVATLYSTELYCRSKINRQLLTTGLLLGLAQLAKVSALALVPVIGCILLLDQLKENNYTLKPAKGWLKTLSYRGLLVFIPAAITLWAGYQFEIVPVPGFPFPLPAGTHIRIYQSLQEHYHLGHPTFLMGRTGTQGWWWYFPATFALKTPLPTLLLSIGMLLNWGLAFYHAPARTFQKILANTALLLFPPLYVAASLLSTVNIGYRHLLPILPFLYIGIGCMEIPQSLIHSRHHIQKTTRRLLRFGLYSLLLWQIAGTVRIAPHYLTSFNEIAGGPVEGYQALVDSNLDWGQNLWDLKAWMEAHNESHVYYAHYSPARPETYGIDASFLPPDPRAVDFTPWNPEPGLYAIGATVLQGPYAPNYNTYAWFRSHTPDAILGNALFIYKVPPRETAGWVALCANPAPIVPIETVKANLATPDLRVITFNCEQSWILPNDTTTGRYCLPPNIASPAGTVLELAARQSNGEPAYSLYSLETQPQISPLDIQPESADIPLHFNGYQIDQSTAYPGDTLTLKTFWEVVEVPTQTLSLMAHLTGEDGIPIAVGDGLGVPIDQLQPGDVIIQQHTLEIPTNTKPGHYSLQTGAYWLETMERWLWAIQKETPIDQIPLSEIELLTPEGSNK